MLKKEWSDRSDKEIHEITEEDWKRLAPDQPKTYQNQNIPSDSQSFSFFSGSSFSSSTVTRPDGSIEQTKTIRNSDGSQTEILTKKLGDQCHTVTTTTQADGSRRVEESNACQELNDFNFSLRQMPEVPSMFDKIFRF